MKKLIICLFGIALALGSCKSKTNSALTDTSHTPTADTANTGNDTPKIDSAHRVKTTTPAGAVNTPGATGIGGTSPRNVQ